MSLTVSSYRFVSRGGSAYTGTTNIPLDYGIEVTFSSTLNPDTVNASAFMLVTDETHILPTGPDVVGSYDAALNLIGQIPLSNQIEGSIAISGATATFWPSRPLDPEKEYKLLLGSSISGYVSYAVTKNAGSGATDGPIIGGGYTETATLETITFTIALAGWQGAAKYNWSSSLGAGETSLLTSPYNRDLDGVSGIYVRWADQSWETDDIWHLAFAEESSYQLGSLQIITFTTMVRASIVEVPGEEIPITEPPGAGTRLVGADVLGSTDTSDFYVTTLEPSNYSYNVSPSSLTIVTLTFSTTVDATTIDTSVLEVTGEALLLDSNITAGGDVLSSWTTNADKLILILDTSSIYSNNVIHIALDETISSAAGDTLEEDQDFYYYSTFNPYYATVPMILLNAGALLSEFEEHTIGLMSYWHSLWVDDHNFSSYSGTTFGVIAREYVICATLNALLGQGATPYGGTVSKSLGDLKIARQAANLTDATALGRSQECVDKLANVLMGLQAPAYFDKSIGHNDHPFVGRTWSNLNLHPGATTRYVISGSNRVRRDRF